MKNKTGMEIHSNVSEKSDKLGWLPRLQRRLIQLVSMGSRFPLKRATFAEAPSLAEFKSKHFVYQINK